jgi:nicotinamide phosphoribosyltransferase
MAVKATWGCINGETVELFKDPATDDGTKKSAKGLLMAYYDKNTGKLCFKDQCSSLEESMGEYKTVFINGQVARFQTLAQARAVLEAAQ